MTFAAPLNVFGHARCSVTNETEKPTVNAYFSANICWPLTESWLIQNKNKINVISYKINVIS